MGVIDLREQTRRAPDDDGERIELSYEDDCKAT